jgi:hypothetical protein
MRAWMAQPTAPSMGSRSNVGGANPHAPRLLPAGGASVHGHTQQQDGGWFNGSVCVRVYAACARMPPVYTRTCSISQFACAGGVADSGVIGKSA